MLVCLCVHTTAKTSRIKGETDSDAKAINHKSGAKERGVTNATHRNPAAHMQKSPKQSCPLHSGAMLLPVLL